jgi:alpha-amylase
MNISLHPSPPSHTLATDLDGTLIPLSGSGQQQIDLRLLAQQCAARQVQLVFVTGRHFQSVLTAIQEYQLPAPQWILCDVGTSIYQEQGSGSYQPIQAYQEHLEDLVRHMPIGELRQQLRAVPGVTFQEAAKQGPFKLSLYCSADRLPEISTQLTRLLAQIDAPYELIASVDPFDGEGLIDLLPRDVSKAYALDWWSRRVGISPKQIVFAGDSGNDLAALAADYRAILVGNADRELARQVAAQRRQSGTLNGLFLARASGTSGVVEGCRWFGLIEPEPPRQFPLGATPLSSQATHFRVWAPRCTSVDVELVREAANVRHPLLRTEHGYFSGTVAGVGPGDAYQYVLDGQLARPDPASRFQPAGVHGPSQVVSPHGFAWTDQSWRGIPKRELILYELHVGAFSSAGTFRGAIERLDELVELGITAIELMPVAQTSGRWNWGYDGVDLYAVRNTYGSPDDFKALVDECHRRGLGVILDVVYNHVGPEGNYLGDFGPYFSRRHGTPWGDAFDLDGRHATHVRKFLIENAIYWLREYHLDGLRLDAVHFMRDDSDHHILTEIRQEITRLADQLGRRLHLIAETNVYDPQLLSENENQAAYDAIWCDCLMHSIYAHALPSLRLTNRDYHGLGDFAEALRTGYLYTGPSTERVSAQQREQFHPQGDGHTHIASLVTALQTHDCVGNHPHGKRIHELTSKAYQRAVAGVMMLYPSIPMIFMGEESASDARFPFFADFQDRGLRRAVDRGRMAEYAHHDWQGAPLPSERQAFRQARCFDSQGHDPHMFAWYRDLLALRKQAIAAGWLDAAAMTVQCDPDRNLVRLRYDSTHGTSLHIQARLDPPGAHAADSLGVPLRGQLLLSSEPEPRIAQEKVELLPNHTVISYDPAGRSQ